MCVGDINCLNQSQCAKQNVIDLLGLVSCWGFDSCNEATIINAGSSIYAYGAYSAFNAIDVILGTGSLCWGESSCRSIGNFQIDSNVMCYAFKSCSESNITRSISSSSGSTIYLQGYKSGAHSFMNLYQWTVIRASAALSLYQTTINIYDSSTILAYVPFSLSGVHLYCADDQVCTIYCYGYGCANISSATGNGTYNAQCTHNFVSNVLCNTTDDITYSLTIDFDNDLPDVFIETMMTPNNKDDNLDDRYLLYKNTSNYNPNVLGINCADSQQCEYNSLNYSNKAICCTSFNACFGASGTLTLNETLISNIYNYNSSNLIDVYCGGYESCRQSIISINSNGLVNINNRSAISFDMHCDGFYCCYNAKLNDGDNLFCGGSFSCQQSTISFMKNVFGTGYQGVSQATISNTIGDVYCIARSACQYSTINQTGGNVYGFGFESMKYATISNYVNNTIVEKIYVIGYHAGDGITINNAKSVYASGYQVLRAGKIYGIRNFYVNGSDALKGSLITTFIWTSI